MQVHAAETARDAARAQRYPTLGLDANYGDIGSSFANSHGTFAVTGSLKFNIFDSGKVRSMSIRPTLRSASARMRWPISADRSISRFARRCWI